MVQIPKYIFVSMLVGSGSCFHNCPLDSWCMIIPVHVTLPSSKSSIETVIFNQCDPVPNQDRITKRKEFFRKKCFLQQVLLFGDSPISLIHHDSTANLANENEMLM